MQEAGEVESETPSATPQCEGCGNPATLQCPSCKKLNLVASFFCNQTCFKANWNAHKAKHKSQVQAPARNQTAVPSWVQEFTFSGPLRPHTVTPRKPVPAHIVKPDYHESGDPNYEKQRRSDKKPEVKSAADIEKLRAACLLGRQTLDFAHSLVEPGVTTDYIDEQTHQFIIDHSAYPSPLNYRGFPKSLCSSVNEVICHGIPDLRPLEDGDILNIDITVFYQGMHGDLNETYLVGNSVARSSVELVTRTYECLQAGIDVCRPGMLYRNAGQAIQKHADEAGLSVVRTYCGHGLGRLFHTAPSVPHYADNKAVGQMKAGHAFTIEPMINQGSWRDITWGDNWTSTTIDGSRSAQFEHTLLVTPTGVEVLTARLPDSPELEIFRSQP